MKTFYAIIGIGPNDLEIPLVICETKEQAQSIVDRFPTLEGGWLDDKFVEREGDYVDDDYEWTAKGRELAELIFREGNYYAGCGGCYNLEVKEFEFGKPMVGWDLD